MKVWTGTVRLFGTATRGMDAKPGEDIRVRIALDDDRVTVDRHMGVDGVGAPRWAKLEPREIMPESLCRALAETGECDIRKAKEWPEFIEAIGEAVAGCDACSAAVEAAFAVGGA